MADNILARVYTALTGSTALAALVDQVCYEYPEDFENLPAVTYRKEFVNFNHVFSSGGGAVGYSEKAIAIDIWSNSPDANEQIAEKVTTALSFLQIDTEADVNDAAGHKHKSIKYLINE